MKSPEKADKSIEELREALARQILELALDDPNAQFKLDSYKATARPPDRRPSEAVTNDAMSVFQARVRKAAEARDGSEQ